MNFFEALDAACAARNVELDRVLEEQQAQAVANRAKKETEEKLLRRNWAVGVLEAGNVPLDKADRISAAMMIVATDTEIACTRVERLLLKHEVYRPIIYQSVIEKFLDRGGDPAGELGVFCIRRALSLEPGSDLFKGDAAQSLAMALLVLGRFNGDKRPEIAGAYALLRKMFPFTRNGNFQNIPHGLGAKLYPEHYKDGHCDHHFTSQFGTSEPRKIANRRPHHHDRPEEKDQAVWEGMKMAERGQLPGIRLLRTGTD
jgi:hypothetical protein